MTQDRPRRVLLGVGGGIAAYKVCELLRLLVADGVEVTVVPTESALRFVGAATWEALSGRPVRSDLWQDVHLVPHVRLAADADLVVIAPATADLLARAATGLADDLLGNVLLASRGPRLFVPAMHTQMWEHPATAQNVATLRARGDVVIDPAVGRLTGPDTGVGRLPEPEAIFDSVLALLDRPGLADLAGCQVLVSAGGTREPIDPVRFLGNRSSGRQGYALAAAAAVRGAEVTVVAANVALPDPAGSRVVRVESTEELRTAVLDAAPRADVVIMAAAVADFRAAEIATEKIKKTDADPPPLRLTRTPDVLAELAARRRPGQLLVGFAAETTDPLAGGRAKLAAKGVDVLVINEVGPNRGFDVPTNAASILVADSPDIVDVPLAPKVVVANRILDVVAGLLPGARQARPSSVSPGG
ncbi:Phosphopantothenate-cysteine ligase / Phosphopantothenoylcysteine decarboxylase [Acidothermus cellulolyticus 11B]|uniref:Coenzyme A biosynthesis bifunctional protein CoaBC n=1 Tax=Acidothermus cellulolyticus (strain ATCC 43068 / DSM 8971 / 11B) TaxID=351607 RepID=A0LUF3_ACIC1|nr:bifunctional phosphopantothenoylcysteine decarboxylase/phosphopantothenate--cysteine ligase CoaBC [Acidothermus cellulolyticus]ABK53063.1 Phosphopantothenate-cysteine ligase / Phosphopantothenoylcysteine decarboxylase [Acidothermus cellulolyticus 11B]